MSIAKFLDMLATRSLFFARCDLLGDPHEGAVSPINVEIQKAQLSELWATGMPGTPDAIVERMSQMRKKWQRHTVASCWHVSQSESAAMWGLYGSAQGGVAVSSTFGSLKSAIADAPEPIYAGLVEYVDYSTTPIPVSNLFSPFLRKRLSFEHEHELRAMMMRAPTANDQLDVNVETFPDGGLRIRANLDVLIEHVHVSPQSAPWVLGALQATLDALRERSGILKQVTVEQSAMDDPALF